MQRSHGQGLSAPPVLSQLLVVLTSVLLAEFSLFRPPATSGSESPYLPAQ